MESLNLVMDMALGAILNSMIWTLHVPFSKKLVLVAAFTSRIL